MNKEGANIIHRAYEVHVGYQSVFVKLVWMFCIAKSAYNTFYNSMYCIMPIFKLGPNFGEKVIFSPKMPF